MAITVEAVYEDGVLKPAQPLPLQEHEKVRVTVHITWAERTAGIVECHDPKLIEWAALDPELEYPPAEDP